VLSIKALRSLWLFISLGLSTLFLPNTSFAALIDVQQKNDIVYFLFAAPNKIVRYDLNSNAFLSQFSLTDVPTAFHVNNSFIYTGYDKTVKRTDLEGLNTRDIYQVDLAISQISSFNDTLFIINGSTGSLINTIDNTLIKESYTYNLSISISSQNQLAYYYRAISDYSTSLKKYTPGEDIELINSNYPNRYDTTSKLFMNPDEDKIYANSGFIFSADTLHFKGSLGAEFDHISFIDNKPLVIRDNTLYLYDSNHHDLGSFTLNHTPSHIAAKGSLITSFITTDSLVDTRQTNINKLTLASPNQPANPENSSYIPENIISDGDNMLYLLDSSALAIHRRKISEKTYASSWGLLSKPSQIAYSHSSKRLYLGYESGRITYFETSLGDRATEVHFITLTAPIVGLLTAGDFIYAADKKHSPTINYSIDDTGDIIGYVNTNVFSDEYLWNETSEYILFWNQNQFRRFSISNNNGSIEFVNTNNHNQDITHQPPINLSPNGQLLLNGSGQIIGAQSYTVLNNLTNPISDSIWIKDQLITVLKDSNIIQFWQEDYQLVSQHHINNTKDIRLFSLDEKLLIVSQSSDGPAYIVYDLNNIPDTDADTINDLNDNCINISNTTQADSDSDYIGDLCDPDNDNDLIPNTIESQAGLNSLDATDAILDLDNDGFSNLVEFFNNTAINDINSKPGLVSQYSTDFNNGIPLGFYQFGTRNLWSIKNIEDNKVIASGVSQKASEPSSLFYTANFSSGQLKFDYKIHGNNYYYYNVELYLDGTLIQSLYTSSGWRASRHTIENGIHTLEFRFAIEDNRNYLSDTHLLIDNLSFTIDSDGDGHSDLEDNCPNIANRHQWDDDNDGLGNECDTIPDGNDRDADGFGDYNDNCPDTYNPDQSNVDNDYRGDACDDIDDRPADTDQDGIPDYNDNCPATANHDQKDFDHDRIGDLCDIDIDNDGLLNAQENQFDFLSSYNAEDALLDFDNDGASNEYEINHDTQPTESDTFTAINLADYYPLGNVDYFYVTDNQFIRVLVKPSNKPAQFIMQYSNGTEWLVERRASGIYLLSYKNNDNTLLIYSNMVIFPGSMSPGQILNITSSAHREGQSEINEFSNQLYLKDVGETAWQGKIYPSITLVENGNATIYLKGVGPMNRNGLELDSLNLDTLASPEITAPEKSNKSGGHFNLAFLLGLLLLATIKARNNRSH
jgi:hypothetical protein